ncbi:hypothetical protein FQN54_004614 [Arachnomyces sp. PD_36]|nr:hypothetical protein FQN54_004614 [Arachnomyces sp. PD_36]
MELNEMGGPHTSVPAQDKRATANHQSPIHGSATTDFDVNNPAPKRQAIPRGRTSDDQRKAGNSDTSTPAWQCGWQGCDYNRRFGRKAELMRHIDTKHVDPRSHHCPKPGCPSIFNRMDNLNEHFQRVHK